MKEQWLKWKEFFFQGGKNRWLIFLLAGLILVIIALPTGEEKTVIPETEAVCVEESDKAAKLGGELERVLSRVAGVGEAKVLVTLKSDGRRLVEKDSTTSVRTSSGSGEGSGITQENSAVENTIY